MISESDKLKNTKKKFCDIYPKASTCVTEKNIAIIFPSHICNLDQPIEFLKEKALEFYGQEKYDDTFNCSLVGAQLNDPYSTGIIGWHYQFGVGTEIDLKESNRWYEIGNSLGDNYSKLNLAKNLAEGIGISIDKNKAFKLVKEAADEGYINAEAELGFYYLKSIGVSADYAKAFKYFKIAAEKGNIFAQGYLGWMYSGGRGVELDYESGFYWTKKAADLNNVFSQANLGWHYHNGLGVEKNLDLANKFYEIAKDQGNEYAKNQLENLLNNFDSQENEIISSEDLEIKLPNDTISFSKKQIDDLGNYYALVIGNNKYKNWVRLDTAVNDAKEVAQLLKSKFNFNVKLLIDEEYEGILDAIYDMRMKLTNKDNLLIYFAGHGELDKKANRGYWIPVDGDIDRPTKWISNQFIIDQLRASDAKHILIIADSCFSASLTRGKKEIVKSNSLIQLSKMKTRVILTSGGLGPVLDGGGENNHSVFASVLIKSLRNKKEPFSIGEIFPKIRSYVQNNVEAEFKCNNDGECEEEFQTPEFSDLRNTGHEGGDFIFVPN